MNATNCNAVHTGELARSDHHQDGKALQVGSPLLIQKASWNLRLGSAVCSFHYIQGCGESI